MDDKRRRIGKRTANRSTKRKDKQLYRKVTEANWWQQLVRFFKIKRTNKTTQEELPKYNRRKEHKRQNDHREGTDAPKRRTKETRSNEKSLLQIRWVRIVAIFGVAFVLALVAYTTILFGGRLIVDEDKLVISPPTTIETTDGDVLWYLYDEFRLPVKLDDIPEHVQEAFIAIEDRRFYHHTGVDLRSIARAVYRDIVARDKKEGASTITQQLAKNLFLTNDKSWWRKIKEAMIALYLEREYTKDQLLEMYLNVIYFGQGQYGVEAAANRFFHKSVDELTLEEGALLAGIIKAPNGYSPIEHPEKALERRNLVLESMEQEGYITNEEKEKAKEKELVLNESVRKMNEAHHTIVDLVIQEAEEVYDLSLEELKEKRYRIVTSLDKTIQEIVYDQFQYDGYFPGNKKENVEGAFVMIDQATGQIVAAQGGRNYIRGNLNRVVEKRQPGSTFKPLAVFAPALESGKFSAYSMLPDELREWDGHEVRNYDNRYEGTVSLYDALTYSKNSTSYWLLNEIGIPYAKEFLQKMNIEIEDDGLSIALGGLKEGVSPLELVQGYRAFVHGGEVVTPYAILEIYNNENKLIATPEVEREKVFSEQVAWEMTEMLKAVVTRGTAQAGHYPYELAGKTGTTQHTLVEGESRDAWFVGFTPDYVSALWIGYDVSDEEHYLTGGSAYPTQLTKAIYSEIAQHKEVAHAFKRPDGVQALSEPIELPKITDLVGSYTFGGFKLLKGKLQWSASQDHRVVYKIYEKNGDETKQIGEVTGEDTFIIDEFMLFKQRTYYVVPYNPLTDQEGEKSNEISLP